jgi:hypothetical protein
MPFDVESAAVLWINKLNATNTSMHLRKRSPAVAPPTASSQESIATRLRIHKDKVVEAKVFPTVQTLFHALNDGRSLLSIILFYFPDALKVGSKLLVFLFLLFHR